MTPTLNDTDLERLLADCLKPVAVLFDGGDDKDERDRFRHLFDCAAVELGKRARFVRISVAENPSAMRQWIELYLLPEIVVFRWAKPQARLQYRSWGVRDLIEKVERAEVLA